jgi:thiaminase (transcriptional activator TenA)
MSFSREAWSREAWQRIAPLYRAILDLPFNRELAAGSLSRERFTFYMLQDAHYLAYFARALAVTAARAPDNDALIQFAGSAREAVVVERALHEGFFKAYGVSSADAEATEPSPTCAHYTHYLLALAHNAPYEVAVAALLPCFWIYWEVGKHLLATAQPDNPYQAWIDTYADEAFAAGVPKSRRRPRRQSATRCIRPSGAPPSWSGCSGTARIGSSAGRCSRPHQARRVGGAGCRVLDGSTRARAELLKRRWACSFHPAANATGSTADSIECRPNAVHQSVHSAASSGRWRV